MMADMQLPFDLATSQDDIAYKKELANALLKQYMTPQQGQMISGHYIAPGVGGALVQALTGLRARELRDSARADQVKLGQDYNTRLQAGLENYFKPNIPGQTLNEGQVDALLNSDQDPGKLAEPGYDPKRAAIQAIGTGIPELKAIGMDDLKAIASALRKQNEPEEFGTDPRLMRNPTTGALQHVLVGKRGTIKPVNGYQPVEKLEATRSGQLYNPYSGTSGPYLGEKYGPTTTVNGEAVQFDVNSGKAHQVANRPPETKINVTQSGQKAGIAEWSQLAAKTVSGLADEARGSVRLLGQLNQMERSGQLGTFSGPTANAAAFVSNLANSLGVPVDQNRLANSETFGSASIAAWQDMIKQAGGNRGLTAPEAQQIMQMVPQLSQSPQGRQQLIAYLRQLANQTVVDAHTAQNEYADALSAEDPRRFTFGLGAAQIPRADALSAVPGASTRAKSQALPLKDTRGWQLHYDKNGNAAYVSPDGQHYEEVK